MLTLIHIWIIVCGMLYCWYYLIQYAWFQCPPSVSNDKILCATIISPWCQHKAFVACMHELHQRHHHILPPINISFDLTSTQSHHCSCLHFLYSGHLPTIITTTNKDNNNASSHPFITDGLLSVFPQTNTQHRISRLLPGRNIFSSKQSSNQFVTFHIVASYLRMDEIRLLWKWLYVRELDWWFLPSPLDWLQPQLLTLPELINQNIWCIPFHPFWDDSFVTLIIKAKTTGTAMIHIELCMPFCSYRNCHLKCVSH